MYTVTIGQRLLRVWLERTGEELTARRFFDEQLYPLFFAPEKMLQWVPNSPFAQQVPAAARRRAPARPAREFQLARLHELADAVDQGAGADASFAVGFPAAGSAGTTSGQVSDNTPRPTTEQVYCSWLGAALGIGTAGGLCLLLQNATILWALMEGWVHYRALLDQHPDLKGHQLETWNGRWLAHALSPAYDPAQPLRGLAFADLLEMKREGQAITSQPWVPLLFALSQHLTASHTMAYVYALGKTNRTIGFIPLYLAEIRTLADAQQRLFALPGMGPERATLAQAYETRLGLAAACEAGSLGLVALEPGRLRPFLAATPQPARTPAQAHQQHLHQLWLLAMLPEEPHSPKAALADAADRLAASLLDFARHETALQRGRGKTDQAQLVEQVFAAASLPAFIRQLTRLLSAAPPATYRAVFEEAVSLATALSPPQFPLFLALIHFRYVARSSA